MGSACYPASNHPASVCLPVHLYSHYLVHVQLNTIYPVHQEQQAGFHIRLPPPIAQQKNNCLSKKAVDTQVGW